MRLPWAAPLVVWHRQFDPEYDLASAKTTVRYALCTTPRSGSHFLGHLLQRAGVFGYPLEYFNPVNAPEWRRRAAAEGVGNVVQFLERRRTSANGCFGVKLHYSHLTPAVAAVGLRGLVDDHRFILLRRRDVLGQAISLTRASQTGAWISGMPERAPASYDHGAIAKWLDLVLKHNAGWQRFFAEHGILPLELAYEDVAANPAGALAKIAEFLTVDLPDIQPAGEPRTRVQRTGVNDDWRRRFVEEMRGRHFELAVQGAWTPESGRPAGAETLLSRLRRSVRSLRLRRRGA